MRCKDCKYHRWKARKGCTRKVHLCTKFPQWNGMDINAKGAYDIFCEGKFKKKRNDRKDTEKGG